MSAHLADPSKDHLFLGQGAIGKQQWHQPEHREQEQADRQEALERYPVPDVRGEAHARPGRVGNEDQAAHHSHEAIEDQHDRQEQGSERSFIFSAGHHGHQCD